MGDFLVKFAIFWLIAAAVVIPLNGIINTKRKRTIFFARKDELNKLKSLIESHQLALRTNWHKSVSENEYGAIEMGRWEEEVTRFVISTGFQYSQLTDFEVYNVITEKISQAAGLGESASGFTDLNDPFEFERYCSSVLKEHGWDAINTKKSGDQGADVIAKKNGISISIQCKFHAKPVGNKAVQEALAGKLFHSADAAAVVATKGFTNSARQLAQKTGVLLLAPQSLKYLEEHL